MQAKRFVAGHISPISGVAVNSYHFVKTCSFSLSQAFFHSQPDMFSSKNSPINSQKIMSTPFRVAWNDDSPSVFEKLTEFSFFPGTVPLSVDCLHLEGMGCEWVYGRRDKFWVIILERHCSGPFINTLWDTIRRRGGFWLLFNLRKRYIGTTLPHYTEMDHSSLNP